MPSIRADKQVFPFFNSVKVPVTAAGTSDSFHNSGFDTLALEVSPSGSSSSVTIEGYVEGCINIVAPDGTTLEDADCAWTQLALIDATLNKQTTFEQGIYFVGINGMARVRVVVTSISGSATIVGVAEV